MNFLKRFGLFKASEGQPAVVTFTGGMGAQIISAAIYFLLKSEGREVYADLSYFDHSEYVATSGRSGDVSHWAWQLGPFGLDQSSFESISTYARNKVELIEDGPQKMLLGVKALQQPAIQERFSIEEKIPSVLPGEFEANYLCVHVRRGDYVNVASHLVSDSEFLDLSKKFAGLTKCLVVVSDSPIEDAFRKAISVGYEHAMFLDDIDAFTSHCIMRNARILICSNSQFSLIAALLSRRALVVLPKQWFGGRHRAIEAPIHDICGFQLLNSVRV